MAYTNVSSTKEAQQIMQKGNVLKKDNLGGYSVEYNGKTYYIPKYQALLSFGDNSDSKSKDITYWPQHFADYYEDLYSQSVSKRKELKEEDALLHSLKNKLTKKYNEVLAKYNAKNIKDITSNTGKAEAKKFLSGLSDVSSQLRKNSAAFLSACHSGLDAALKGGEWNNILAYTKQVGESLS